MAATITWSVDSHLHETAGKKCVLSVAYRVTAKDGNFNDSACDLVRLDRPSDSDMKDYADFMGTGDTNLVAALKAQLGSVKVKAQEDYVKASVETLKAPTETWTEGPSAA